MTSAQYKQAYYHILKNGYSLNLKEVLIKAWQNRNKQELQAALIAYLAYAVVGFGAITMPLSYGASFLALYFGVDEKWEADIQLFFACIFTHFFTLSISARCYKVLNNNDSHLNRHEIVNYILPLTLLLGTCCFLVIFRARNVWDTLEALFNIYSQKSLIIVDTSLIIQRLAKNLLMILSALYLSIALRLALPIMLYAKTNLLEALWLSISISTQKFFHFLFLEIAYLLSLLLTSLVLLIGIRMGLEFTRVGRFLVSLEIIREVHGDGFIEDNIEVLIDEIGKKQQE